MKKALEKWNGLSLIISILIGLIIGVILGLVCPSATVVAICGDVFVGALKAIAPVLVFVLVMSSLANAKGGVGKRFTRVIALYMITTCVAAFLSVVACKLFPVTLEFTEAHRKGAPVPVPGKAR